MKVKDLKPELKELFYRRALEYGEGWPKPTEESSVDDCFNWSCTPENHQFWEDVNYGEDVSKSKHYPKPVSINNYQIY
jgi:hypothetical protein